MGPVARDLGKLGFEVLVNTFQHDLADKETEMEQYVDIDFTPKDLLFKIPEFQKRPTCSWVEKDYDKTSRSLIEFVKRWHQFKIVK